MKSKQILRICELTTLGSSGLKLTSLGLAKQDIPMVTFNDENEKITDIQEVLAKWKRDLSHCSAQLGVTLTIISCKVLCCC